MEEAPFTRPSRGAFRHLYGPVCTPLVQPRFCDHVDVAPGTRAKVALDQVPHRHPKMLRELTLGDIRALTGWVTPAQPLVLPTVLPAGDEVQYWMLREMDDDDLAIVCEVINRSMRGEQLEALSHGDLQLLPKKPPHGIGANERPLSNLVLLRKVVGLVVKEEEQPWLWEHGFLPPRQFALWPGTSIWDFLRVLHDYFWHRWASWGEAWPVLDNVRHAFGSPDHVSRDSVHQVVGYGPELCLLHRSLVEDMRLDIGGTDDVDHAEGWCDAGSGQGCPLSLLEYAPMKELRANMVSQAYPGVLSLAGLLQSSALADDTVWLRGSPEDAFPIARALPTAEEALAMGSDVSKMRVLRTWMDGQRVPYRVPSVLMTGVRLPVPSETEYIRTLGQHALPHTYHKEDFREFMTAARRASAVIPIKSLRAQYHPAMYNPKAGGMALFQAGVRPPPVRVWHLADLPAVSALRAIVGENLPAHRLLGSVQEGLSGKGPLGPDVLTTCMLNYARQLNHPNPLRGRLPDGEIWAPFGGPIRTCPACSGVWRTASATPQTTTGSCAIRGSWKSESRPPRVATSWRCASTPWLRRRPSARRTMVIRPWRWAIRTGQPPAARVGRPSFLDRSPSPRCPDACGGPGRCTLRGALCRTYPWRRFLCRTPLGIQTKRLVAAWWWQTR